MGSCPLCTINQGTDAGAVERRPGLLRRAWSGIPWLVPATLLALMPKCPLCVAAYIALFTGIGVSVATAHWIRCLLLAFCVAVLSYLAFRACRRRLLSVRAIRQAEIPRA